MYDVGLLARGGGGVQLLRTIHVYKMIQIRHSISTKYRYQISIKTSKYVIIKNVNKVPQNHQQVTNAGAYEIKT